MDESAGMMTVMERHSDRAPPASVRLVSEKSKRYWSARDLNAFQVQQLKLLAHCPLKRAEHRRGGLLWRHVVGHSLLVGVALE